MKSEKILLPFGNSTVLETILATLGLAGVEEVVCVLRPDLPDAARRARAAGARIVWNAKPEEDMLLSIRMGLEAVSPKALAIFIWPADCPAVSPQTVKLLARSADPGRVLIPAYRSRRGHPALLGRDLIPAVDGIPLREGLRHLWRTRAAAVAEIAVDDPGVLQNLDTPEAYQAAIESPEGGS
jgi:CTP:molybdopterin cytidylyltransferase MocA